MILRTDESIIDTVYKLWLLKGKGYPDVNTRRFLRRLWDELQLPALALVDADPHGISILAVYRFGSQVCTVRCIRSSVENFQVHSGKMFVLFH